MGINVFYLKLFLFLALVSIFFLAVGYAKKAYMVASTQMVSTCGIELATL